MNWYLIGGAVLLGLVIANNANAGNNGQVPFISPSVPTLSYLGQSGLTRGKRNNNPGNIIMSGAGWQGAIPQAQNTDGHFEQFIEYRWGVRAMIKLLQNYINNGYNTTRKIINRWAPDDEDGAGNNTTYINFIVSKTGFNPDSVLQNNKANLLKLVKAMAQMESGQGSVSDENFEAGWLIL